MADAVRTTRKPQFVLEKDHALSYLLTAIYAEPGPRDMLVFKGGTCLRKAYFPGYRFSEDLDFTARAPLNCADLEHALGEAAARMRASLEVFGPFQVIAAPEAHRGPHPDGQCSFRVRVQYPWMRTPDCSLKVEVTMVEPLLGEIRSQSLIHEFPSESLDASLPCYSLEEIAAEKLRAFLQGRQRIEEQGWSRNRPRDLYDLWHLRIQQQVPVDWREVGRMLPAKAEARGVSFVGSDDFLDERVLAGIKRDWRGQLANFVPDLPSFEECVPSLTTILKDALRGDAARPGVPAPRS